MYFTQAHNGFLNEILLVKSREGAPMHVYYNSTIPLTQDDVAQRLLRQKSETKKGGTENSTKISGKCPPTAFGYISISFFQEGSGSILFNNPQGEFIKTH